MGYSIVTYEEAQRLIPFFRNLSREAPYAEMRRTSKRILGELRNVRGDVDYKYMGGHQIVLSDPDSEVLDKALIMLQKGEI